MAICINRTLFIASDNSLIVGPVKNTIDEHFINNALVNVTLKDANDNNVSGQPWPLRLTYISDSDGLYTGVLQDTLDLEENNTYLIVIEVDAEGLTAYSETETIALTRG